MVGEIRFENVKKQFVRPDGEIVNALNGVDLTINQGDFVCLIGPSGCGKSTLLRILAGLEKPSEGNVYLEDEKITRPNYDRGLAFQDHSLFPWLNIYDNTMHLYATSDNDSGATNVVMRADGTALLLGSGRGERFVP